MIALRTGIPASTVEAAIRGFEDELAHQVFRLAVVAGDGIEEERDHDRAAAGIDDADVVGQHRWEIAGLVGDRHAGQAWNEFGFDKLKVDNFEETFHLNLIDVMIAPDGFVWFGVALGAGYVIGLGIAAVRMMRQS